MSAVTRFQILRGSTAQRLAFIPLQGELVHDTETNFLYIGDGATFGGVLAAPLATAANKLLIIVRNESGALLPKGTPVYITSFGAALPLVDKAIASDISKSDVIGILESDLANNSTTTCVIAGEIINLNLSAFTSGDQVYLAPTGGLTNVKPVEPNFIVAIGNIEKATASGILLVHINDPVVLPNLPNNHVPIGQTGGNTTTVDIDAKIVANAQVTLNTTHRGRTDNPHATTKAQVGLGNADNTSDVNKPVSTAQAAAISSAQTNAQNYADTKDATHFPRTDNPHATTKAQVGLGNADNTSDLNKPISTATQTALNLKYDASNPNGYETPTQLNARDTANRARANHTGTQLASTISDFSAAVLANVLTGLSLATGTAITAADSVLSAFGKLQKQISDNLSSTLTALNLKYDASNPNGYETPTQLNARDTANRSRANHTGTQLASTISDFAASVRSTVLTGVVFTSQLAVTAADSILVAIGKLQAQIDVWQEYISTTTLTSSSNSTLTNITELTATVTAGKKYYFEYTILFQSNTLTTNGFSLSMGGAGVGGSISAIVNLPQVADGTNALYTGSITAFGDVVGSGSVEATNTTYIATIKGVFNCTTGGTIFPQFRSENNLVKVSAMANSVGLVREF